MGNFDQFIYKYRYFIGAFLIIVILAGSAFLIWQKINQNRQKENQQIELVKKENEALRSELSGKAQVAGASSTTEKQAGKININTADLTELDKIPSVGPVIAGRIIDYRNQNGNFVTIEDLKNVKGIGDKTFEKIVGTVTVGN